MTAENTLGTILLLLLGLLALAVLALPVLIVTLLIVHRRNLIRRWRETVVAAEVELAATKKSRKRFLGELAVLSAIAFLAAEILTKTGLARDEGFIWLLIGLPVCFLLARFWWRKYH